MPAFLIKLLGINWGTTLSGLTVITAAVTRIGLAWKARDFHAIINDSQLIAESVLAIAGGLGLLLAKDKNVTGAGTQAKAVASTGDVTNIEGQKVGEQSPVPPQPRL